MKVKRELFIMYIILAMLTTSLSSTGQNDDETDSTMKTETLSMTSYEIDPDKVYEVSWVGYQTAPINEGAVMLDYWKDQKNIDINIENIEFNKWNEILNLKMAAGEIPDRVYMFDTLSFAKYVEQGVLTEIPMDVLKKYGPNYIENLEKFSPGLLENGIVDGKLYGLPTQLKAVNFAYSPIWREDWLRNVGITKIPETLDEAEEAFYKFANEDPDGNGRDDTYGLSLTGLQTIFMAYGYFPGFSGHDWMKWNWYNRDGEIVYGAVQPEMKEALKRIKKWYEDGIIDPEFITGENKGGYWALSHAFTTSKIGYTTHGGPYKYIPEFKDDATGTIVPVGPNLDELLKLVPNAQVTIGAAPIGPDGHRGSWKGNSWDGKFIGFGAHLAEEPDKLSKLIDFTNYVECSDPDVTFIARNGLEGVHWKMDGEKLNVLVDQITDLSADGAHVLISSMDDPNTNLITGAKKMWYDYLDGNGCNDNGLEPLLMPILPSESKYKTDLDSLVDEAYIMMIASNVDIDSYFDNFVQSWMDAGGEILTEEANQ